MDNIVARAMDVDFIYFDLTMVTLWIVFLIKQKRYRQLLFGFFGFLIVFSTDDLLWYHLKGTRHIEAPIQPDLFLLYFSFTYGMIMFSFAPLMFEANLSKREKISWACGMFFGWLAIALLSQWIPIDDRIISIYRDMQNSRLTQILMVIGGYALLLILRLLKWKPMEKIDWKYFLFLFAVGIFIHFSMESTLLIAGIRPLKWDVLVFDSLVEFNSGIPYLFMAWSILEYLQHKKVPAEVKDKSLAESLPTK
ncbi:MAG: hypothetical protein ACTSYD_10050 [Candidatus Heimdallarchaeaceae archaeon]